MKETAPGEQVPWALGRGRYADVYDLGGGRVLRWYRVDYDHLREIAVLRRLCLHAQSFPASRLNRLLERT